MYEDEIKKINRLYMEKSTLTALTLAKSIVIMYDKDTAISTLEAVIKDTADIITKLEEETKK